MKIQIVTGAIRSKQLGLVLFRVEDIIESELHFYGVPGDLSDEEVEAQATKLQESLNGDEAPTPYTAQEFEELQVQIAAAGDFEFLDHLV